MVNNLKTGDSFIQIRMTHESGQFVFVTKDVRNNEATLYSDTSINISFSINQLIYARVIYFDQNSSFMCFINSLESKCVSLIVLNKNKNRWWNHRRKGLFSYCVLACPCFCMFIFLRKCYFKSVNVLISRDIDLLSLSSSQQSWLSLLPQHPVSQ